MGPVLALHVAVVGAFYGACVGTAVAWVARALPVLKRWVLLVSFATDDEPVGAIAASVEAVVSVS